MDRKCPHGYTYDEIVELMGDRLEEFREWMAGQTVMLCDGQRFNHETKEYEFTECAPYGHGGIVYAHDAERFLAGTDPNGVWD